MKYFIPIILLLFFQEILSQEKQDTINISPESTSPDSILIPDTTASERRSDVDTVIYSSAADSLIFFIDQKKMNIYGNASLQYKDTDLKSANIFVDFETNNIEAVGVPSDSAEDVYTGTPVLSERGEVYEGFRMKYNFSSGRGYISSAGTEMEGAIYTGAKIKKVDEETFFIEDGIYTTCDIDEPHYHFYSEHMKVIHQEQIVADWIWLNFGGVPFPIPIPFAVFPIESGRRSGILPPAFGDDANFGRYFSRFGYFWAISDYMDWNLTADYYTRGSYSLNSRFRYAERYNYTGNLEGGYSFFRTQEAIDPDSDERKDWRIKWFHNQNITPTLRLDANLEFVSGNYLQRNVTEFSELLRNEIISNANLFKSWDESGNSLSLSYSRRQTIETGDINEILPRLTFNMSQKYPFRSATRSGEQKWYETIGYNYSGEFQNNRNKTEGNLRIRGGIQHNVSVSASPKAGYISFTPNIRYQERWYNKRIVRENIELPDRDSIATNDVKEINMLRTFGLGVSSSTKFYGIFNINNLGISSIRHTVNPSISYNYTPDFSEPFWGYYDTYIDSNGNRVKYDKFEREIYGGAPSGEQQSISFSISNIFEMKTAVDPTDTTSKENKIQLLNLTAGIGYNFAADSLNFSDLNLSYRTQIGDFFNFSGSSTFTPYSYDINGRKINKFLINEGRGLFRLTNFDFSISTSLSGERLKSAVDDDETAALPEDEMQLQYGENRVYRGIYDEQKAADFSIPWDISLSYNYRYNNFNPFDKIINSNLSGGINFNLTPAWKFSFTGSYDFTNKEFAAPQVRISRDLHCWVMDFTWNPIGTFRGYRFEIRVKAPQLNDLKITKRDQFYTGK